MKEYGGLDRRYKALDKGLDGLHSSRNSLDLLTKLKKRADQV